MKQTLYIVIILGITLLLGAGIVGLMQLLVLAGWAT